MPRPYEIMGILETRLCTKEKCSLIHILSCCRVALHQRRYAWRHDSVLLTFEQALKNHIKNQNAEETKRKTIKTQRFVKEGGTPKEKKLDESVNIMDGANDWKLLIDFDDKRIVFPPTICPTNLRPDIIIWSDKTKTIIWAELTCPAEENIKDAQRRKTTRYKDLAEVVRGNSWTLHDFTIEVGVRGCMAKSVGYFLRKIGIPRRTCKELLQQVSNVVTRCSFAIYLASTNAEWPKYALINSTP